MLKPTKYCDIYLAEGLHKDYKKLENVFTVSKAKAHHLSYLEKSVKANSVKSMSDELKNYISGNGYYFEDSEGIVFKTLDLFYRRYNLLGDFDFAVDGGLVSLEKKGVRKEDGIRYGVTAFYKHFSLRVGKNVFDDFSEIVPTLKYQNSYKNHSYLLEYTRQNALFYTYTFCPYDKQMKADHFSISDYVSFKDKTNVWANITLNSYGNGDIETVGQFDWRFYYDYFLQKNFTYDLALEGYYVFNTKESTCFYSPSFSDATLLRIDPNYRFNRYLGLKGMLGAGYSFEYRQFLYKYGLWLYGDPLKNFSYNLGCMQSNSSTSTFSGDGYYYKECKIDLGYRW